MLALICPAGEFDAAALHALCDSKDIKSISENAIMRLRVVR